MKRLSNIPDAWLNPAPNLDSIWPQLIPGLTEGDISWNGLNALVSLIRKAETASFQAFSHRDFRVGAAAIAWDRDCSRIGFLTGFNFKPSERGEVNIHAEQMAIEKARRYGLKIISTMAVWGQPQEDEETGLTGATLHPCGLCRDMMQEAPEISANTAILSGNEDFSVCELYGLEELTAYHYTEEDARPRELQHFTLADEALESRSYDEALGFWLLKKWAELNPSAPNAAGLAEWFEQGQPSV